MLFVYNILSFLALIFYFPKLLLRKGPEDRITYIRERLGKSKYEGTDIWIHAVSVGEVIAALPFLKALNKEFPGVHISLSTTTYTGQKIAHDKFPEADRIMYMPWDTGSCIKKTVNEMQPKLFITIETELWPVLFRKLKQAGSRTVILNGRLSQQSFKGYRLVKPFMKKILSNVYFFYMQGKGDVERIIALGANPEKVGLMGNFKYDITFQLTGDTEEWLNRIKGEILVAGSTHKGEEEIILDAFRDIRKKRQDLQLILAPRHPERFKEVEELIHKWGFHSINRSTIHQEPGFITHDIILLDTIGELSQVYARADIAFVGGSLQSLGGHNILEPAYWGKPILFGPHMDNFPMASDFIKEGAGIEIRGAEEMAAAIEDILGDVKKGERIGQKAKKIVEENMGAVEKALQLVRSILGTA
ncbi:MAG: 3-deoxy-D-manno-octulosonic acid transferase [Nitrospiraceae bacterium]|nr:MAG: 3-deoxy-D-manno-octulosonic acid transferase [Nitrospiraceae bacterium]